MNRTVLSCALTLVAGSAASANILVNGGFEDMPNWNNGIGGDGSYTLLTGSTIPGWTVADGHGATIHNNPGAYPTISGAYSLNTDGEGFNDHNVKIYQDFASSQGMDYNISYDWENWFTSDLPQLNISIVDTVNGGVLVNSAYGLSPGLHHELFDFVGTGHPLRLTIEHIPESGFNDNTFIVDNFEVTAVPAPGAAAVLGLGGLVIGRRRR